MPQRISDIFQVSPIVLREHNVYNGFIEIDSKLYVDPRLLAQTSVDELKDTDKTVLNYFDVVLKHILKFLEYQKKIEENVQKEYQNEFEQKARNEYLQECKEKSQKEFEKITEKLKFPEIPLTGLGYSINSSSGKGIGVILAEKLSSTVIEIVKKGIEDPIIFELAGVFEKNFGSDRISDMIFCILLSHLVQFSCRIAEQLNLPIVRSTIINGHERNNLPSYLNKGILLVPEDILTSLPVARSWTDRDLVTIHNHELRKYVNKKITKYTYLNASYKQIVKSKTVFRDIVLQNPVIMSDFISKYKAKTPIPYDFKNDPNDEFKWHDIARDYAKRFPLKITDSSGKGFLNNEEIVEKICVHFRDLVNLGLDGAFYRQSREPKEEEKGQLILLELIEQYLKGSPLSVKYAPKEKVINLCHPNSYIAYRIILKFTSTPGINRIYDEVIQNIYIKFQGSYTILFLIEVDRGKTIQEIVRQSNIKPSDNENKFFRKVYINAKSKF